MIDQIVVGIFILITLLVGFYADHNTDTIVDFIFGRRYYSSIILVAIVLASVVYINMTTYLAFSTYFVNPIFLLSSSGIRLSTLNIPCTTANNIFFMTLKNTGDGINKLNMPKIFDEYFFIKSPSSQGLAFFKKTMKSHSTTSLG